MFNWYKKESPILSMLGLGGGIGSKLAGGGSAIIASGGNVDALQPGNGYVYHTFTSPGTLTMNSGGDVEVLMVAGGGSGGCNGAGGGTGGGGGGGLLHGTLTLTAGPYPITVGADTADDEGQQGNPTTAFGATANGGGFGRFNGNNDPAPDGGSGGGGCAGSPGGPGGDPNQTPQPLPYGTLTGYGGAGSAGISPDARLGGGGGGAGGDAPPQPGTAVPSGPGKQYPQFTGTLIGVPSLIPYNGYYAGGGGGGRSNLGSPDGTGGAGSDGSGPPGIDGVTNAGGGGGGASTYPSPGSTGGKGGAGIVCIRYAV